MTTPVRAQYLAIKKQYPDAIVFFRLGDFYETFDEDAKAIAKALDIVLTTRKVSQTQRVPMAGVPHHAAENYIARLIKAGFKVAICEQMGNDPINGLVPREVTRVITPGTVVEDTLLPQRASVISSTRRMETPARYISMSASSTLLSRRRYRSMMAVSKETPLRRGTWSVTSPEVVVWFRS